MSISIDQLIGAFVTLIVAGLIVGILWWVLGMIALPEPFAKVARVVLILLSALVLIGVLLSLVGHPLLRIY